MTHYMIIVHVIKFNERKHTLREVQRTDVPGKKGRPKTRWKDVCQQDLKSTGLRAGEEMDRATWSRKSISHIGRGLCREPSGRPEDG